MALPGFGMATFGRGALSRHLGRWGRFCGTAP